MEHPTKQQTSEPIQANEASAKSKWHILLLAVWLFILVILLIAGTAVPHINFEGQIFGFPVTYSYGLFEVKGCVTVSGSKNCNSEKVSNWSTSQCNDYKMHFQAASAFAILSIFVIFAALVLVVVHDLLCLFVVADLLSGIVTAVGWFFMMLTWAIIAGAFTRDLCDTGNSQAWSKTDGASYTHGFFLFLISWLITIPILAIYFLRQLKIF